jgi:hypothetical protein
MMFISNRRVIITFSLIFALSLIFAGSCCVSASEVSDPDTSLAESKPPVKISKPDIQWFKDQMKISDKYRETHEGILGISWIHFFVMIFLILFGIGALLMFGIKQKRLKEIISEIQKEAEDDNESRI